MAQLFKSYLQSDFGSGHKNFEAVVLEGRDLRHWWRDNSAPGNPWKRGQRIIQGRAAFPGSIIQSDFGDGHHGNFEVVVPLFGEGQAPELWHMWHDNSDVNKPWSFGQRITEPGRRVAGPASIIQSNFRSGNHGNFEIAAWVKLPDGRSVLQHYWHDNSDVNLPWREGQIIVSGAKGNGVMIQSSFGSPHGNFEVVVPIVGPSGKTYLQHVWHDNSDVNLPWRFGQTISEVASAEASATSLCRCSAFQETSSSMFQ